MRILLTASFPVETMNAAIRDGSFQSTLKNFLDIVKPEAAYFTTDERGNRSAFIIVDIENASDMPAITTPLFVGLNAQITLRPVMVAKDLEVAAPAIERAVRSVIPARV